ncbi:hypothetical protein DFS33DRAFT_1387326 [Desarmillaria ectypa]|nr:hypothetical protein DFS33DRAFT_1387326 [Desarmillaria ectypa]
MGATAVVAIYQASQSIYDIFNKTVVLYDGGQIYFAQTDDARRFFIDMGFHCPERQTTADFLASLTNPAELKMKRGKESAERKLLLEDIDQFDREFPTGGNQLAKFRKARRPQQAGGSLLLAVCFIYAYASSPVSCPWPPEIAR